MKVLISGGSGFLGRAVIERLLERGHTVRAIVRPASLSQLQGTKIELFPADLRTHKDLTPAFDGMDAVIHLAAATSGNEDIQFSSTVVGTERLLEAMTRSAVRRLVHVSSLVVYDWAKTKNVMDENSPLLREPYDMGAYTIAKVWQEKLVARFARANAWDLTVLRPGFIWGPRRAEIAGMGRRFRKAYVLFGPFTRLPLCHLVNCADCIVAAIEREKAIGQTFNVIDDDDVRVFRYVREYRRRSSLPGIVIPLPYTFGYGAAKLASLVSRTLFGKSGKLPSLLTPRRFESQFKPLRFSNRKLKDVLAWGPPSDFERCLDITYK